MSSVADVAKHGKDTQTGVLALILQPKIVRWHLEARFQGGEILADIDLVLATIAILFEPPQAAPAITQEQIGDVLHRPINIGQTPDGRLIINSTRDQIEIQLFPNKIDVRDLSGELAKAKEKVPEVVSEIINLLLPDPSPKIQTYGVNIVVEFPMTEPNTWIGETFLKDELGTVFASPLSSNEIAIRAIEPPKTIMVKISSRENSRVNINFNASEEMESLPDVNRLAKDLGSYYARTIKLVEDLKA